MTWDTRPARTGAAAADVGTVAPGTWVSFDVTALVTGNGTYAFDLATASADETVFSSRETKVVFDSLYRSVRLRRYRNGSRPFLAFR